MNENRINQIKICWRMGSAAADHMTSRMSSGTKWHQWHEMKLQLVLNSDSYYVTYARFKISWGIYDASRN